MSQFFNSGQGHNISTFEWQNEACFNETARVETTLALIDGKIQENLIKGICMNN